MAIISAGDFKKYTLRAVFLETTELSCPLTSVLFVITLDLEGQDSAVAKLVREAND